MSRRVAWLAAIVVFLVHLIGNAHYGFFRDELYFIICGRHPQWGYVDQPPVVPLLAALSQIFGHSLLLLRLVPALFAAGGAFVTCMLVTEFGGGEFAQALASLSFLFAGVLLSFGQKVGTDEVGLWTWPLLAYLIVRIVRGADPRLWLAAGAVAGLSFESKYSVVFYLAAVFAGLLLTPQRRTLLNRWFALGSLIMVLIALPNVLWQAHYGFPMWELLKNGQNGKNIIAGPILYFVQEILIMNLFFFPVWILGLVWLLRKGSFRFLGYAYIVLIVEMLVLHGKHYYPANIYPILLAAGGVQIEARTARSRIARTAILVYAIVLGPIFVPFSMPILPESTFLAYNAKITDILHIPKSTLATEHGRESAELPGDWADMHGWPELAAMVESIYNSLPPNERSQAVVVTSNYGEAGAINFFAPDVPVISGHNQYWLWGTLGYTGNVVIDVNGDCGAKEHLFAHVTRAGTLSAPYAISYETDAPIMLCRGLKVPLETLWPSIKKYE
jgi:hypothetical protein